jgi:dihydropyrimidinase
MSGVKPVSFDCIIRGGTLATAERVFDADIGITGGKIAAIEPSLPEDAGQIIDASGLVVAPGAVDVHTHFDTEVGEQATADDYESGSRAAAAGGITTYINFAFQEPGAGLAAAAEREVKKADGHSLIDYGFHMAVLDPRPDALAELAALAEDGFTSIKIFTANTGMALPDRDVLRVMQAAADAGLMVNVHAEDEALVDHLTQRLLSQGHHGVEYLPAARPPQAEAAATARVTAYAAALRTPVYIVHLSSRAALDAVRAARGSGAQVYVETRPAYLYLDAGRYRLPARQGNKYVCWPPLREPSDQDALWAGLRSGEIQTYATDHTTWMAGQKMDPSLSFEQIPGGVSNVQTSIGMLYAEGVQAGRIPMTTFVAVTSTNPAKLFGLWPRKGCLGAGSDADLVVLDPARRFTVTSADMHSRSDFDPYEGYEAVGWPVLTISRGEVIVRDGQVLGKPGRGQFVRRSRYQDLAG